MHNTTMTRSAAALAAAGAKLHTKEEAGLEPLVRAIETNNKTIDARLKSIETEAQKANQLANGNRAQIKEIEQSLAGRSDGGGYGGPSTKSAGQAVIESDEFKAFGGPNRKGRVQIEVKTITSAPTSAGSLIAPDRSQGVVVLPRQRFTIRDLLGRATTTSNMVEYSRQVLRDSKAAFQTAEGALKAESNFTFELASAGIKTLAHWTKCSKQALADAPLLQSIIDGELRYGLGVKEEAAVLLGDGTSNGILGLIPQAEVYDTTRTTDSDTRFDIISRAISQAEEALLPVTGVVLHPDDADEMRLIKNDNGDYIAGGPFGPPLTSIWGRPLATSVSMPKGAFLVGAMRDGATIVDREDAMVEIDTTGDDFIRNLVTVLAEQRFTLIVTRPASLVFGTFPA